METQKCAVRIHELCKDYSIARGQKDKLRRLLFRTKPTEFFRALDHINAEFPVGERIGLIGLNGSGKSTLSSIISGITLPTEGEIEVNGTVSMLNTNVGLNPQMTGRESIYYKCLLLGFDYNDISHMEKKITDFADIGIYIDQPMHTYSSGMKSRLGFAISAQLEPDILVVDEALAVGDESFASKCEDWMIDFCDRGHTIIFVSHSLKTMQAFCQRVLWLHKGKQIAYGEAEPILNAYHVFSKQYQKLSGAEREKTVPNIEELLG